MCTWFAHVVIRFVRKLKIVQKKRQMESENTKYKRRLLNRMLVEKSVNIVELTIMVKK